MISTILMTTLALLAAAGPTFGQVKLPGLHSATPESASDVVTVSVTADRERLEPGATFHLAVVFDIAPHWHIYWVDPGDAGAPTELALKLPPGFTAGPVKYPRPRIFREPDGTTFGYDRQVVLFVPVQAPPVIPEIAEFEVETFYLVCREICLMGRSAGTVRLPAPRESRRTPDPRLLARFMQQVPRPLETRSDLRARLEGGTLVIEGDAHPDIRLFPIAVPGVTIGTPTVVRDAGRFRLTAPVEIKPHNAEGRPMSVRGVLAFGTKPTDPAFDVDIPVETVP